MLILSIGTWFATLSQTGKKSTNA